MAATLPLPAQPARSTPLALNVDGTPAGTLQRYQQPLDDMYELSFLNDVGA